MRQLYVTMLAAFALLLTSCISRPPVLEDTFDPGVAIPDTTTVVQVGELRISPMDMLNISVFGVPEFDGDYQVDFTGRIKMPLIGDVEAKGLNAAELAAVLEQRLEASYLQNADVRVSISTTIDRRITVDGSVQRPGIYPIQGQLYLLQAVALAGGPSDGANPERVIIFRQIDGKRMAAAFDLQAIRQGEAEDPIVFGNDIIVIDGSEARRTYGDILRSIPLLSLFVLAF